MRLVMRPNPFDPAAAVKAVDIAFVTGVGDTTDSQIGVLDIYHLDDKASAALSFVLASLSPVR